MLTSSYTPTTSCIMMPQATPHSPCCSAVLRDCLLIGRSPRLPVDLAFNLNKKAESTGYLQYIAKWKTAMQEAYTKASTAANINKQRGTNHPFWNQETECWSVTCPVEETQESYDTVYTYRELS